MLNNPFFDFSSDRPFIFSASCNFYRKNLIHKALNCIKYDSFLILYSKICALYYYYDIAPHYNQVVDTVLIERNGLGSVQLFQTFQNRREYKIKQGSTDAKISSSDHQAYPGSTGSPVPLLRRRPFQTRPSHVMLNIKWGTAPVKYTICTFKFMFIQC